MAPVELENILRQHPAVADCAVIGVPDERAGQLPRAYIVKKAGYDVKEADISAYFDEKIAPFKRLKGGVEFTGSVIRSSMGKILRREILAQFLKSKQWFKSNDLISIASDCYERTFYIKTIFNNTSLVIKSCISLCIEKYSENKSKIWQTRANNRTTERVCSLIINGRHRECNMVVTWEIDFGI